MLFAPRSPRLRYEPGLGPSESVSLPSHAQQSHPLHPLIFAHPLHPQLNLLEGGRVRGLGIGLAYAWAVSSCVPLARASSESTWWLEDNFREVRSDTRLPTLGANPSRFSTKLRKMLPRILATPCTPPQPTFQRHTTQTQPLNGRTVYRSHDAAFSCMAHSGTEHARNGTCASMPSPRARAFDPCAVRVPCLVVAPRRVPDLPCSLSSTRSRVCSPTLVQPN